MSELEGYRSTADHFVLTSTESAGEWLEADCWVDRPDSTGTREDRYPSVADRQTTHEIPWELVADELGERR